MCDECFPRKSQKPKTSTVFFERVIDRLGRDSRRLQLLFRNDAYKQACDQLGRPGGAKSFLRGAQIF